MANEFCLKMPDFHVTFRDLLHAVNLHGTNGFTFLPKEGVLRIFSPLNPRTWVPKASTLPLDHRSRLCAGWRFLTSVQMHMKGNASHAGNRSRYGSRAEEEITPGGNRTPIPLVLLEIISDEATRAVPVNLRGF